MEDMRSEVEIKGRLVKAQNLVSKYLNKGDDKNHLVWRTVEKELKWVLGIGNYGINCKTIRVNLQTIGKNGRV